MPGSEACINIFQIDVRAVESRTRYDAVKGLSRETAFAELQVGAAVHCSWYAGNIDVPGEIRLYVRFRDCAAHLISVSTQERKRHQHSGVQAIQSGGKRNIVFANTRSLERELHSAAVRFCKLPPGDAKLRGCAAKRSRERSAIPTVNYQRRERNAAIETWIS